MKKYIQGVSLVEIVIASAIIITTFTAIIGVYNYLLKLSYQGPARIQSTLLAQEGIEAVRTMRDNGWTNNIAPLSLNTEYYLYWTGTSWQATTTATTIDSIFYRTISFAQVYRDGAYNITTSGTLDTNSRKVTSRVSWFDRGATSTRVIESYIFNTFND